MTTDHRLGTSVGDYLIEDILGRGGMGVVYRARHRSDGRVVALKLMLPELAANEDFRDRFIREAEFGPALDHPNIVTVYETGEVAGELFIAMHLVEGCDLKTVIKQEGRLAPRRAMSILVQAASALDAAHEMVVVHRDVKPQNIMIAPGNAPDEPDHVFLTDFGLIRPMSSESSASRTGQIFGSIQYMAPEQIEGLPADGRADVYSLACVAFECFTGHIPFERPNEIGAIWAHIHEEPPRVSDVRPDLPGGIDDVIRQGMAKHPDDRYLTCGELVSDLEAGLKKQRRQLVPTPLRPLVRRGTRPKTEREIWAPNFFPELSRVRKLTNRTNWAHVAAIMAALLLLPSALVQFVHPAGVVGAAADVGDAVASLAEEGSDLFSAVVAQDAPPSPAPVESGGLRTRAAQRNRIGVFRGAPRASGPPEVAVAEAPPRSRVEVPVEVPPSLAETKIVFNRSMKDNPDDITGDIFIMNADGTDVQRVMGSYSSFTEFGASLSPDGSQIAFVSNRGGGFDIYVMDVDGTDTRRVTNTPNVCENFADWSPDGHKLLFTTATDCGFGVGSAPSDSDIWVIGADGTGATNLSRTVGATEYGADWSPDGRWIVFDRWVDEDKYGLYVMKSTGGAARRLPAGTANAWGAIWCGGYIVFTDWSRATRQDIYRVPVPARMDDPDVVVEQLTDSPGRDQVPTCSPDGRKLAFTSNRTGEWQIHLMNADGSDQVQLVRSPHFDYGPSWQAGF